MREIILHNHVVMFTPYERNVLPPSQVNKNSAQLFIRSTFSFMSNSFPTPDFQLELEAGNGSCNREIRVVIGVLFIPSNLNRVKGFNTCHLVQRKNHDLYCSCVCCSSQHPTNAKTKLSNRAGLSFFHGTYCA